MKLCNIIDIEYKISDSFSEYEVIDVNHLIWAKVTQHYGNEQDRYVALNFREGALPHSTLPPRTMPLRSVPFSPGAMPARRSPSAALPSLHPRLPADRLSPSLRPHPPDDLDRSASDMGPPLFGRVHLTRPSSHLASGI